MGTVTIKKPTKAAVEAAKAEAATATKTVTQQKVDRLVELNPLILAHKPIKKEFEALRKEMLDMAEPEYLPHEVIQMTGTLGQVQFGAKADGRVIKNMEALHKKLGDKVFYELVSFALGDVDKYLTAEEKDKVIDNRPNSGPRSFNIFPLPSA